MSLAEKIQKDLVDAMRAKEELRLSVLRGIKAAIKHREVEEMRALDESESIQILQTHGRRRRLRHRASRCKAILSPRRTRGHGRERHGQEFPACPADFSRRNRGLQRLSLLVGRFFFQ